MLLILFAFLLATSAYILVTHFIAFLYKRNDVKIKDAVVEYLYNNKIVSYILVIDVLLLYCLLCTPVSRQFIHEEQKITLYETIHSAPKNNLETPIANKLAK